MLHLCHQQSFLLLLLICVDLLTWLLVCLRGDRRPSIEVTTKLSPRLPASVDLLVAPCWLTLVDPPWSSSGLAATQATHSQGSPKRSQPQFGLFLTHAHQSILFGLLVDPHYEQRPVSALTLPSSLKDTFLWSLPFVYGSQSGLDIEQFVLFSWTQNDYASICFRR